MRCPKCDKDFYDTPALSREDNKTEICPECGMKEALEAYYKLGEDYKPVVERLYHCQNLDIGHYSDAPEDRFVWATGALEARDKLKSILDDEEIDWNIDDFEFWEIRDEDGNLIERIKA